MPVNRSSARNIFTAEQEKIIEELKRLNELLETTKDNTERNKIEDKITELQLEYSNKFDFKTKKIHRVSKKSRSKSRKSRNSARKSRKSRKSGK